MELRKKLIYLLDKSYSERISNLDYSIELAKEALLCIKGKKNNDLKAKGLSQLSLYYMITGNYDESLNCSQESIKLFEKLEDEKGVADAKYSIAGVYYKTNNHHTGVVFLIDALNIYKKYDDYHNISKCEKSLGTIYEYTGDQKSAVQSYENAIEAARKIDDLNLESNVYNNLSGIYIKQDKIDLAFDLIKKSVEMKEQTKDIRGLAFAIYGRGKVLAKLKKFKEAEKDYLEAINIHSRMGERLGLAMTYNKMARLYLEFNKLDKAKKTASKCIETCEAYNMTFIKFKCFYTFYLIYKLEVNKEKALEYLELYIGEKESVLNTQTLKIIDNYEMLVKMKIMQKESDLQKEKSEMIEKNNRAEEATRVRQEFLSTMSHEIRTPLNAVTTIVSMLDDPSAFEDKSLIDSLKFSSNHLMRIINDILDFTKLDLGKMNLDLHPSKIVTFLENFWKTYEILAREKGLKFKLKIDPLLFEYYYLDETKITQILGNLVNNSIKFTDIGIVKLEAKVLSQSNEHDTVLFKISDTGEGIDKENLDKVFESFSQLKNVITRKKGGTGLGLTIVKKLIELHDSKINVESKLGRGTIFSFQLILKKSEDIVANNEIIAIDNLVGKKILLAEDNMINAMIASKLLSKWGIITDHVINGLEAVNKALINNYDFILMDIHMPEMDGFEAAKVIKSSANLNTKTPIFGLTADISAKDNVAFNSYFNDFLLKPLEIDKLYKALSS